MSSFSALVKDFVVMKFFSATVAVLALGSLLVGTATAASVSQSSVSDTTTPIKHLVVIFQENVSFDHYFGTYPKSAESGGGTTLQCSSRYAFGQWLERGLTYN